MTNTRLKWIVPAVLAAAALSACSSTTPQKSAQKTQPVQPAAQAQLVSAPPTVRVDNVDATKEAVYKCGAETLNVMYGIKGKDVVVAQVKYKDILTPGLFRVSNVSGANAFWGNGISWTTEAADAANVTKVNGRMLTQAMVVNVNGRQTENNVVLFKGCALDKAATAKLNRAKK
ncbi:Uncharacterised protein [Bergeriella denitrificans]|uniref:Lipoprotein n=2 Tax=Bergeriella denitrificans TaxID=494 RepID=A0A378UF49_BERDE|nr:hypothetical protein [Bergeriella denitrificans]STZ75947.1 Uncharacterised protein [Bergeriella denitrificans]